MLKEFEFKAKTVELAAKKASGQLGIPLEKLQYEIISYGSSGIFGLVGARKAEIRARIPKTPAENGISETKTSKGGPSTEATDPTGGRPFAGDELADPSTTGLEVLNVILGTISDDTRIEVGRQNGQIQYDVTGGNTGVLIGKRGQTLEAIQYLVEKIVNKRHEGRIRIQVDIEGYLEKKKDNLKQLAEKLADKARKTGKPATIGQMNAHDRRIVHLALKNNEGVRTQSVGEGLLRKLIIFPRRGPENRRGKSGGQ